MEKTQVLIVEDDAIIAMDLESRMKKLGYGVTGVAGYGEQAIEKVKENTPDVVLMDIILKGEIDGIEAAEEIRTQYDIPVIFLTAFADKDRLKRAKLTYPFGFIIKPFQDKDLAITIEMALYVAKVDSERKQTEKSLQESEELHRITLGNISDAVFLTDDTGVFTFICPNVAVIFGYSEEEVRTFDNISKLLGDNYYDPNKLEALGEIINLEIEVIDKAGKEHDLLVNVKGVSIKGGTKLITCRDITERKQVEEALRKKTHDLGERVKELNCLYSISKLAEHPDISLEEIFQGIVNTIPPSWQYPEITCSRIILEDEEYKTDNFKKSGWKQSSEIFVHGKRMGALEVFYLEEKPEIVEGPFLKEERLLINAITERLGHIIERMQAEEALQKAHDELENKVAERTADLNQMSKVFMESTDPIIIEGLDGYVTQINDEAVRVYGWSREELIGKPVKTIVPPQRHEQVDELMERCNQGDSVRNVEGLHWNKNGDIYNVLITLSLLTGDTGNPTGIATLTKNIDNLKETQEELSRVNEELSQYAYAVSHDIKTPLRAISNYANFLGKDLEGTLDGNQKIYLEGLSRAVNEANTLVEDLLELSRIDRRTISIETVDIGAFMRQLIDSLSIPPDINIVMEDDWPSIDAETVLLRQIFQNLINNGIKFNNSSQKRIELGWVTLEDGGNEFFVRDNGIGIDPRYHEQIFRVFERLHTTEVYEGTGIGLAVAKKAIGRLGGSIRVESSLGKGSTFFITIPKTQKRR